MVDRLGQYRFRNARRGTAGRLVLRQHPKPAGRLQRNAMDRPNGAIGAQLQIELPDNGPQDKGCLLHGEGYADAAAWPAAKGQIGERIDGVAPWRQEPRRVERVRLIPQSMMAVHHVRRDDDEGASADRYSAKYILFNGDAADGR